LQTQRDLAEAVECGFHVLYNFVGRREQIGVVERVILEPENVEIDLVAGDELGIREPPEAIGLSALVSWAASRSIVGRTTGFKLLRLASPPGSETGLRGIA
jgi:hypothetical protein